MSSSMIAVVVSIIFAAVCGGGGFIFLFLLLFGIYLLRKRGQQEVTAKEAVTVAAETVSQVFVRGDGGLQAMDDDDD